VFYEPLYFDESALARPEYFILGEVSYFKIGDA
jgi:hypothetical protein